MSIWYCAIPCTGEVDPLMERVEYLIQECRLRQYIPEVLAGTFFSEKRGRRSFYLYLGIAGYAEGRMPDKVQTQLLPCLVRGDGPVCVPAREVEDLRAKWRARVDGRIAYRPCEPVYVPSVYHEGEAPVEALGGDVEAGTLRHDRLLIYLSALGEGSWDQFVRVVRAIWPPATMDSPERVWRRLWLLGHLTGNADRSRWAVQRPVLVRTSRDGDGAVTADKGAIPAPCILLGARDTHLLQALSSVSDTSQEAQALGNGPTRVIANVRASLEAEDGVCEGTLGAVLLVSDPSAVASALPTLTEWKTSLRQDPDPRLSDYVLHLFDGDGFAPTAFHCDAGMYEFWTRPTSATGGSRCIMTRYFDEEYGTWRRGDWYGLRFLHHAENDGVCPASYSVSKRELAIPDTLRLPMVYERALVLASGLLPSYHDAGGRWLAYRGVSRPLLDIIAARIPALKLTERE